MIARLALALILMLPVLAHGGGSRSGEFRLNVYGLAYHPDRATVKKHHIDNETNPGLGLHYSFGNGFFTEVGVYEDSGYSEARFANIGYYYKIRRFHVGGALALFDSDTYNKGRPMVAPMPSVAVDIGKVRLHAVYFPKVNGFSKVEAYGFYLSVPMTGY